MNCAARLVSLLSTRAETVATCESLTAGLAAARIADVPGASRVLRGGLITYATDAKHSLAGVDKQLLDDWGPVAAVTAEEMARGAREKLGADWGLALTGVAGPDSQNGHPVGEVFIAVAGHYRCVSVCHRFSGDRAEIRRQAVEAGLKELLAEIREQKENMRR
ncbi:hypothetical protein C3B44_04620 [Corynebacterium yudongzhengii]|uniref:CinA family protein n=1 Tax=Corynebacterium yudongzhengii TaxID=2080740 RepID=A0A2U1T5A0_9CORY|nr:CinA family protein [Corynebacterium yudongzhengii]AWB81738.1 hypothetical protein C3B44_04620 [Corynebacterium yudongzhengii]PWC01171.1 CinA family protein [Corynebacterium yudongzhengii]